MTTENKGKILASVFRVDPDKKTIGVAFNYVDRMNQVEIHHLMPAYSLTREQANALSRALQAFMFDGLKEVTVYKQADGEVTTSMFTASGEEL